MQDFKHVNASAKFVPNSTSAASVGQNKQDVFATSVTLENGRRDTHENPFSQLNLPRQ